MRHALFIRATTPLLLLAVVLWSAFWFTAPASARSLATLVVSTCDESHLDAAITQATNDQANDTITFACSGDIPLTSTLVIKASMTLDGSGQSVTLDGGGHVGVLSVNSGVQFTLKALTVANGSSSGNGGGIYNSGTMTISNSTIANNTTAHNAGGIYNNGGTVNISNSTIANNAAPSGIGGGIYNLNGGTVTISNSTIANNHAQADGGGILNEGRTVTISNSTIANNAADNGYGGGIYSSATLSIGATILAGNGGSNCSVFGTISPDLGYNLESGTDCGLSGPTSQQNTSPQFQGGLQNNGGPTQTIALQPSSPAVNHIPVNTGHGCITGGTDQRGQPRPDYFLLLLPESTCDIGAYEVQGELLR